MRTTFAIAVLVTVPQLAYAVPAGALVQRDDSPYVFVIDNAGKRDLITDPITFAGRFGGRTILRVTAAEFERIPIGPTVEPVDGALFRRESGPGWEVVWVYFGGQRHRVADEYTFNRLYAGKPIGAIPAHVIESIPLGHEVKVLRPLLPREPEPTVKLEFHSSL